MFASKGLITCPCPVPVSLTSNRPSSITPTLIHFPISLRIVPSQTLFSIISMSKLLTITSKYPEISASRMVEIGRQQIIRPTSSSALPKSVGTVQKILLVDRVEQVRGRLLHDL